MNEDAGAAGDRTESSLVRSVRTATEAFLSTEADRTVVAVYVYGSTVRSEVTALSDLDLAVLFREDVPEDRRWRLLPKLGSAVARSLAEESAGSREVDVHDLASLPLAVRGRVLTEGVLVVSADHVRRVRFEELTRRRYFDFLPFRERDTEQGLKGLRRRVDGG